MFSSIVIQVFFPCFPVGLPKIIKLQEKKSDTLFCELMFLTYYNTDQTDDKA